MSIHVHALARWRIRRLFTHGIAPAAHRALPSELASCEACAALYRRYADAEAALCAPGSGQPSVFALERTEAAIFDRLAPEPDDRRRVRRRRMWVPAALAGASLLALLTLRPTDEPHPFKLATDARLAYAEFVARGPEASANAAVGIRMLRVIPEGAVAEGGAIAVGDAVTFTYTNVDSGIGYFALFAVQKDGRVRWYYPGKDECCSARVRNDVVDEPLGDGFVLSRRYEPGFLRVTALFSAHPIDKREIEKAVDRLRARPEALEQLAPVPLESLNVREYSIRVEIAHSPRG